MHRFIQLLVAAAFSVLLAGVLLPASPASAEPYPAVPPTITTPTASVGFGGTVTFTGGGFLPFEQIEIKVQYGSGAPVTIKTVTADAFGNFSASVPLDDPGVATVTASGTTSDVTATSTVTVLEQSAASLAALAVTGGTWHRHAWEVGTALAAIALGAGLIWLTAKRRRTQHS